MQDDHIMMDFGWVESLIAKMRTTETHLISTFEDWRTIAEEAKAVWPDGVGAMFDETDVVLRAATTSLTDALGNLGVGVNNAHTIMSDAYGNAGKLFA